MTPGCQPTSFDVGATIIGADANVMRTGTNIILTP
jgi:hypothetical protein